MKSTTTLAAAMTAAVMSAGSAIAAEPSAPKTVAEAKAQFEAYNTNRPVPRSAEYHIPPGNIRAENLGELLAGRVSVSRNVEFLKPILDLQISFTGSDGQVVTCQEGGLGEMEVRRWSWTTGKVRGADGVVRPVVRWQARTPGLGEGPLSLLHDGETGEVVWHSDPVGAFPFISNLYWVQRYSGHLQERLPAATWTLCPDFPSAEELGVGVNHAQTATSYGKLVAQDPGRRVLRPDLVAADVTDADVSLGTWIEEIRDSWRDADGRALAAWGKTHVPTTAAFVFYEPLSAVWELDTRDLEKASGAHVRSARKAYWILDRDGRDAWLRWESSGGATLTGPGWPRLSPEYDMASERHPLADMHDRLLAEALAREVAGLPVGSRFEADGTVKFPEATGKGSAGRCGIPGMLREPSPATWRSLGDTIEIVRFGRAEARVGIDHLVAAMDGDGIQEPEAELSAADEIARLEDALGRARVRIRMLEAELAAAREVNDALEAAITSMAESFGRGKE